MSHASVERMCVCVRACVLQLPQAKPVVAACNQACNGPMLHVRKLLLFYEYITNMIDLYAYLHRILTIYRC